MRGGGRYGRRARAHDLAHRVPLVDRSGRRVLAVVRRRAEVGHEALLVVAPLSLPAGAQNSDERECADASDLASAQLWHALFSLVSEDSPPRQRSAQLPSPPPGPCSRYLQSSSQPAALRGCYQHNPTLRKRTCWHGAWPEEDRRKWTPVLRGRLAATTVCTIRRGRGAAYTVGRIHAPTTTR